MRCTEKGHQAQQCRNALFCLLCNELGHKAAWCRSTTYIPPSQQQSIQTTQQSDLKEEEEKMHIAGPEFHHSPEIDVLEHAFNRSIILNDDAHWGTEQVRQNLLRIMPRFDWKIGYLEDRRYIIESPNGPWLNSVLQQ